MIRTGRDLVKATEVKRTHEKLKKSEMCTMYKLSYNYYMNCVLGKYDPSENLAQALNEYLSTGTRDVYTKLYETRELKESEKQYHPKLDIDDAYEASVVELIEAKNPLL